MTILRINRSTGTTLPGTLLFGRFTWLPNKGANGELYLGDDSDNLKQIYPDVDSGFVVGPASAVDNSVPRFDLTTGKLIQGSGVLIDDLNNITGVNFIDGVDVSAPKNSIEVDSNQYQLVNDSTTPGNSKLYGTNASGIKGWYDQPTGGGGGVSVQGIWSYDGSTSASDPGSGNFRLNNTNPGLSTNIYIADETKTGIDFSTILANVGLGDLLYLQNNEDASEALLVTITGITDNGSWWNFDYTVEDIVSTSFTNGKEFGFIFGIGGGADTPGSEVSILKLRESATDRLTNYSVTSRIPIVLTGPTQSFGTNVSTYFTNVNGTVTCNFDGVVKIIYSLPHFSTATTTSLDSYVEVNRGLGYVQETSRVNSYLRAPAPQRGSNNDTAISACNIGDEFRISVRKTDDITSTNAINLEPFVSFIFERIL